MNRRDLYTCLRLICVLVRVRLPAPLFDYHHLAPINPLDYPRGVTKTKVCTACKKRKSIKAFSIRKDRGKTRPIGKCKPCNNAYHVNRRRSSEKARDAHREVCRLRVAETRRWVYTLKSDPCVDCEKIFKPWQMHFDHRNPIDKTAAISALVTGGNRERILEEIEKCDQVCASCHADRTYWRRRELSASD